VSSRFVDDVNAGEILKRAGGKRGPEGGERTGKNACRKKIERRKAVTESGWEVARTGGQRHSHGDSAAPAVWGLEKHKAVTTSCRREKHEGAPSDLRGGRIALGGGDGTSQEGVTCTKPATTKKKKNSKKTNSAGLVQAKGGRPVDLPLRGRNSVGRTGRDGNATRKKNDYRAENNT